MIRTLLLASLAMVACRSDSEPSGQSRAAPAASAPAKLFDAAPASSDAARAPAVAAPAMDANGRFALSALLALSDEALVDLRAQLPQAAARTRAMLAFVDHYAATEERRNDWLQRMEREGWTDRYTLEQLVAELPIGLDGSCVGEGISAGTPPVQLLPGGKLAGEIESNMTFERYRGRWKLDGDQLVIEFRVEVQETGDLGGDGRRSRHKFRNQPVYAMTSGILVNAAGEPCWLRRGEVGR